MIYVTCNLCGSEDWRVRFPATLHGDGRPQVDVFRCTSPAYGHHPQIVQCRQCGFVYSNPRWSEAEILDAYSAVEDQTYVEERTGRELTFRHHLQQLQRITGPANGRSLLDVGAYIGVFVEVAATAGWDAWGVEPSAWASAAAQARGLQVITGTQDTPALHGRQFDVLTMWDVIEHVSDPKGELQQAHQLLKSGGVLAVHTMDINSLASHLMRRRWPWLMDMHLSYFSQKTMARMLQESGYEIIWSGVQGRYLRLGYLASRVGGLNPALGRLTQAIVRRFNLTETAVPVNFGDLFTVYARCL